MLSTPAGASDQHPQEALTVLYIVPDSPTATDHAAPPGPRKVVLFIEERRLCDDVAATLSGDRMLLRVDPDATEDDQLDAIADALRLLWTGASLRGRPHLRRV